MSSRRQAIDPKQRTSQGLRVSALRRFANLAAMVQPDASDFHDRCDAVWDFLASDQFAQSMVHMTGHDRLISMMTVAITTRPFADDTLIPPPAHDYAARVRWDAKTIAELRAIAAKYGVRPGLDRRIAREMCLPLRAATAARYQHVGRIERPRPRYQRARSAAWDKRRRRMALAPPNGRPACAKPVDPSA